MTTPEQIQIPVAVQAEALYLINLLLLPGLGFGALLWLAQKNKHSDCVVTRCHLRQTIVASLWAGLFLGGLSVLILILGGFSSPYTWMALILYFLCVHSVFILLGVVGLVRAMAQQTFVYPLIGSRRW